MVAGFPAERWPDWRRNGGRFPAGIVAGFGRNTQLNHTMEKMDGTYNVHDYNDAKQMAMETLERRISSIVTGQQIDNIIPFQRRA